jgi:hypothetical protein
MSELLTSGESDFGEIAVVAGEGAPPVLPPRIGSGNFWRFIHDRNPFYLLSAICMFAGYRMILGAMDTPPGDVGGLVPLIAVLNLYEFALIGLALFLIRKRGLIRDGWFLLIIQAMFLVDLTNLQSEVFTASLSKGLALNAVCYLLAMVKIAMVLRGLRLRVSAGEWSLISAGLFILFGMAGGFKALSHDGSLDPRVLNGAWWIAGLLAAAWAFIPRAHRTGRLAGVPVRLYMLIPFASIIVHLCGANRVYAMDFYPANVTPVLLGLGVAMGVVPVLSRSAIAKLQMSLIVLAALVSLTAPRELSFASAGMALSPMRLTLLAATVVCIAAFLHHRRWAFAFAAAICLTVAAMGHTLERVRESLNAISEFISKLANAMVPTTPMGWGVVAVIASFVLLAVGAMISLRKGEMREEG